MPSVRREATTKPTRILETPRRNATLGDDATSCAPRGRWGRGLRRRSSASQGCPAKASERDGAMPIGGLGGVVTRSLLGLSTARRGSQWFGSGECCASRLPRVAIACDAWLLRGQVCGRECAIGGAAVALIRMRRLPTALRARHRCGGRAQRDTSLANIHRSLLVPTAAIDDRRAPQWLAL